MSLKIPNDAYTNAHRFYRWALFYAYITCVVLARILSKDFLGLKKGYLVNMPKEMSISGGSEWIRMLGERYEK